MIEEVFDNKTTFFGVLTGIVISAILATWCNFYMNNICSITQGCWVIDFSDNSDVLFDWSALIVYILAVLNTGIFSGVVTWNSGFSIIKIIGIAILVSIVSTIISFIIILMVGFFRDILNAGHVLTTLVLIGLFGSPELIILCIVSE